MSGSQGIPASWYPDPADPRAQRYWDGTGWTQHVRAAAPLAGGPGVSSVTPPVSDFTGYDRIGHAASYVPFSAGTAARHTPVRTPPGRTSTVAIWLYALVPLLLLAHQFFGWEFSAADPTALVIHGGLALATVVLAVLLAAIDRSQLRARGYERTPPAILGLLPPIHVFARLFATSPGAVLVTLVSLAVQGAVAVALVFAYAPAPAQPGENSAPEPVATAGMTAPFTEEQLARLLTAEGMAEKIRFDAAGSSLTYDSVVCDPLPSTDIGAQTTCHAAGGIADYDLLVQVLPDGDDTPFAVISVTPELN